MQHVFRPKHFTLFASSSQWDPSLSSSRICFGTSVCISQRVFVCLCAPPLFPESSAQLDSECALRPHIIRNFYEGASQSISSVLSGREAECVTGEVTSFKSTLRRQQHTAHRLHLCHGRAQNCKATTGKEEAESELQLQSA